MGILEKALVELEIIKLEERIEGLECDIQKWKI